MGLGPRPTNRRGSPPVVATARPREQDGRPPQTPKAPKPRGLGYGRKEQDVAVIAAGLMGQDSPLMQKAEATGLQAANRRGLLNSSMAVGAAQSAVLDHVVPMASQTAQQNYGRAMAKMDFRQNRVLQRDAFRQDRRLQRDTFGQQKDLARMGFDFDKALAEMNISAADRRGAETLMANWFNDYNATVANIMNNPNLPADEREQLLQNAEDMLSNQMRMTALTYGTAIKLPKGYFGIGQKPTPQGLGGGAGSGNGDSGGGTPPGGSGGGKGGEVIPPQWQRR